MQDVKVDEMMLELHEKINQIIFEDSISFLGENVNNDANSKIERPKPHSDYFLILCLVDIMKIKIIR